MLMSGQETVDAAGTAQTIVTSSTKCTEVHIKALTTNAGVVYVGNDGTDDVSSTTGLELAAGDSTIKRDKEGRLDLMDIWVDAANNDDGVSWLIVE